MEKYPAVVYYVTAKGHTPVFFDGRTAMRMALHFAVLARKQGFLDVRVGAGRGS
jgi:hypothetical protein